MYNFIPQLLNKNYEKTNDTTNFNKLYPMVTINATKLEPKPIIRYDDLKVKERNILLDKLHQLTILDDGIDKIVEGYDDRIIYSLICQYLNGSLIEKLLESKHLKFNVNFIPDKGHSILNFIIGKQMNNQTFKNIVTILQTKNFNFNANLDFTILDRLCSQVSEIDKLKAIISLKEYDITASVLWLYALIHKYGLIDLSILVCNVIAVRPDAVMFLNKILGKYAKSYKSVEKDIMMVMDLIATSRKNILIDMVNYVNDDGNNILHIASMFHLDGIIRFVMMDDDFNKDGLLVKNKGGMTPYNLYDKYDVKNLLFQSVTLF